MTSPALGAGRGDTPGLKMAAHATAVLETSALEADVRQRLRPLCRDLKTADFERLIAAVVAFKRRWAPHPWVPCAPATAAPYQGTISEGRAPDLPTPMRG